MSAQKLNNKARDVWQKQFGNNFKGKDDYGMYVVKSAYRDENSDYGWDVDHIVPKSRGGSNNLDNLQILHILSNRKKGNK